jgi:hypothetical protein
LNPARLLGMLMAGGWAIIIAALFAVGWALRAICNRIRTACTKETE